MQALKSRGHGSLCFYGPPGTGKTALAEHIAHALEQPLLIKQASDLMSKYVGETEQQMAAMLREAEAEKAVLLLDEADSFLRDRHACAAEGAGSADATVSGRLCGCQTAGGDSGG